jgi:predicted DNA repair protein MutK
LSACANCWRRPVDLRLTGKLHAFRTCSAAGRYCGITKLAAASLDDVGAAAGKAGGKAAGVVVDDTAVTPRYVIGLSPERELPIIAKIAVGSLRNKLLILLPAALVLSAFAPWAITPLLMLGGAFLCFEGAEKVLEATERRIAMRKSRRTDGPPKLEQSKVKGAIRTDFILSAEIMAIALAEWRNHRSDPGRRPRDPVGIGITIGVYGVVGLIVKMDDIGLHLAERRAATTRAIGRGLVKAMPPLMDFVSIVGTAAMIWVGGGILVHGLEGFGVPEPAGTIHHAAEAVMHATGSLGGIAGWLVTAIASGLFGLLVGGVLAFGLHKIRH